MEDRPAVHALLQTLRPTHVFNCAGVTGRPNVDWCESNKAATIRSNVIGALNLADLCDIEGIHLTVFATGCIYTYDKALGRPCPEGGRGGEWGRAWGFKEEEVGNFGGSWYSYTKSRVEELMRAYENVLILRLRMPISDDLHPRNFVTKILGYECVVNIPNSMSILSDLLPLSVVLATHNETGVVNFTNPGCISHNEVLGLFKEVVRPGMGEWRNFSVEEQAKVLKAGRSNCCLSTERLEGLAGKYGVVVPEVQEGMRRCFERMVGNGVE
ncbi:NAD dependent epimerase [Ascobolus immersus RN42]|uniref:NAD dependent epimerase n=1 Tax=Ascobolus immersus RN42 TaxID=1160509 RepID=A0A3N4I746_ASCIM|nr:NAD dependent epimerase [Ascobolus immersus RN42]